MSLIYGTKNIARYLSEGSAQKLTPRQVNYMIEKGRLPTFKIGPIHCTTPDLIRAHFNRLALSCVCHCQHSAIAGED